jgi:uncharacterized repeat protein (TIGR02543 family)
VASRRTADLQLTDGGTVLTFPRTHAVPESQVFAGMVDGPSVPKWPKFGTTSANATFGSGTVVTLRAVARPGDTFTGWADACTGAAITCDVTIDQAKAVTAHFRGPHIIGVAGPGGTIDCSPTDLVQGGSFVCTITPDADHVLLSVMDNGSTVTGSVSNGTYSVVDVAADHTVSATFDARPDFVGSAPTTVAAYSTYLYTPVVADPDGPAPLTITVDPSDTCGGVIDPVDGRYSFTLDAEGTCLVAITACDAAGACRTQQTTVTITVVVGGFLDGMGASGGGCGCSAGAELAALPWYGIPALVVLVRRRRRKDGEREV